jgi:ABC-type transporter Mla subunit MlaD
VPLSDAVILGLFQGLYQQLEELTVTSNEQYQRVLEAITQVEAAVGEMNTQVDAAVAEITRIGQDLASRPDLAPVAQRLEAVASGLRAAKDELDAAVPDAPAPPPAP